MEFEIAKKQLVETLFGKKSFAIGYHPDADGIAATTILIKHLEKQRAKRPLVNLYPVDNIYRTFELQHLEEILKLKHDVLVCIDYNITKNEQLYYISKKIDTLVYIDHHRYRQDLAQIPTLYINSMQFPQLTKPELFTASKLMNSLLYDSSNDWLELLGLDGDVAIQSLAGSPIYEAARCLNMVGLTRQKSNTLESITATRNKLVDILLKSENVWNFNEKLAGEESLVGLYDSILKNIDINVTALREMKETVYYKNNKIYVHRLISQNDYDISEHVLKAHLKYLGYNETFVIYLDNGDRLTFRIYTSNSEVDCQKIAVGFNGGGHRNRAGVTNMQLDDLTTKMVMELAIEKIKEMIDYAG